MNSQGDFATFISGLLNPATVQGALLLGAVIFAVTWGVTRAIRALGRAASNDGGRLTVDRTSVTFLQQFAQVMVWLIAIAFFAHAVPQLRSLGTALLAGVSIASVVIGLAAQSTLSNFIAGISLLLYRPFRVGDRIQVNAPSGLETGVVEAVMLGYTALRTQDRRRVVVPNSIIANQVTVNLTYTASRVLTSSPFRLSGTGVEPARAILRRLAEGNPDVQSLVDCPVTAVSGNTITLTLRVWCVDLLQQGPMTWALIEASKAELETAGIRLLRAG